MGDEGMLGVVQAQQVQVSNDGGLNYIPIKAATMTHRSVRPPPPSNPHHQRPTMKFLLILTLYIAMLFAESFAVVATNDLSSNNKDGRELLSTWCDPATPVQWHP